MSRISVTQCWWYHSSITTAKVKYRQRESKYNVGIAKRSAGRERVRVRGLGPPLAISDVENYAFCEKENNLV
ncbi:unnamed protein product, partial [Brenthis ino]